MCSHQLFHTYHLFIIINIKAFMFFSYSSTSEPSPFSKETPSASNNITFINVLSILNFSNSKLKNCVLTFETAKNVYNFTGKT